MAILLRTFLMFATKSAWADWVQYAESDLESMRSDSAQRLEANSTIVQSLAGPEAGALVAATMSVAQAQRELLKLDEEIARRWPNSPRELGWRKRWITDRFGEKWYVIRLPAIAEAGDPLGREIGQPLWPEEKSLLALQQERKILGTRDWNALYQQYPTTEEGAIIKAGYWRKWPEQRAPVCEYIVQSIDGAYEEHEESDYSARTTWGI